MADYNYIVKFKNINGNLIELNWFVKHYTSPLTDYYFTATGQNPIGLRYYDSRLQGSELNINLLIRNSTDETEIVKLLSDVFYFKLSIDGKVVWYGENVNNFFNISYKAYPYQVTITANDRLGTLKTRNQLSISDYPDPANLSLIALFSTLLNFDDGVTSGDYWPRYLWVATSIYLTTANKVFNEVTAAILNWVDDKDEYKSAYDIIESVLKSFNARMIQWNGYWYVIDEYSYDSTGSITFAVYDLVTGSFDHSDVDSYLIDLFATPKQSRFINQDQYVTFIPKIGNLILNQDFQPKKNILPFSNNEGNFYQLNGGSSYLEFDSSGYLRNWLNASTFNGTVYEDGDKRLWVNITNVSEVLNPGTSTHADYSYSFGDLAINHIGVRMTTETIIRDMSLSGKDDEVIAFYIKVKYTNGSGTYWCNSDGKWNTSDTMFIVQSKISDGEKDFKLEFSLPGTDRTGQSLDIAIYEAYNNTVYNSAFPTTKDVIASIKGFKVYLIDQWILENKFDQKITDPVSTDTFTEDLTMDINFGMTLNDEDVTSNSEMIHYSQCRDTSGVAANSFTDGTNTGDLVNYWLLNRMVAYRQSIRKIMNGSIKFVYLDPISQIKDYEGLRYRLQEGTFDLKSAQFNGNYKETQR
jgi:hypothetical protein